MNLIKKLKVLEAENPEQIVAISNGKVSSHGMAKQLRTSVENTEDLKTRNQFGPDTPVLDSRFNNFTCVVEIDV